jgi:hypothetical protein
MLFRQRNVHFLKTGVLRDFFIIFGLLFLQFVAAGCIFLFELHKFFLIFEVTTKAIRVDYESFNIQLYAPTPKVFKNIGGNEPANVALFTNLTTNMNCDDVSLTDDWTTTLARKS